MEFWVVLIVIALAFCAVGSLLYLLSLRASLKEVARELNDKLKTDTNTLISISSGDRAMRTLASEINCQLHLLRKERLKLQHGDMELKNAVTNISHDLRTPLTAICGYLDLLAQQPQSEASERYLSVIRERTDAMRGLTEELFRYSVIAGTTEELHFEPVCLNDILEQSLAGFYGTLSKRGIVPDIALSGQQIERTLDRHALRRIFDNILSNAVKYSDGDLSVRLSPDGTVWFENHAKDLDAMQTAHLFERFYTVNTARIGTGLGLSIAKLLTEKMGGNVAAEYDGGKLRICICFAEQ
jgi:signal transduction histidine kinase